MVRVRAITSPVVAITVEAGFGWGLCSVIRSARAKCRVELRAGCICVKAFTYKAQVGAVGGPAHCVAAFSYVEWNASCPAPLRAGRAICPAFHGGCPARQTSTSGILG
jgi:hypothetical protein